MPRRSHLPEETEIQTSGSNFRAKNVLRKFISFQVHLVHLALSFFEHYFPRFFDFKKGYWCCVQIYVRGKVHEGRREKIAITL